MCKSLITQCIRIEHQLKRHLQRVPHSTCTICTIRSSFLYMTMPSTNNFRAASSLGSSIIRTRLHSQILFIQILAQETTILLHALLLTIISIAFFFQFLLNHLFFYSLDLHFLVLSASFFVNFGSLLI